MKLLAALFVSLVAVGTLSACNTMEGLGRDTQAAGRTVTDTSRDVRR
jgi:entericidin B